MLAFFLTDMISGGSAPDVITPPFILVMWWDW